MSKKRGGFDRMNGESSEDTDLNIEDYDEKSGKKKRYLVKDEDSDEGLCKLTKLTKREIICIIIGCLIITTAVIIFAVLAVVLSSKDSTANARLESTDSVRLPSSLVPQLYNVSLDTNMNTFTVNGSVVIAISVQNSTNIILLHAKDMTIKSVSLTKEDSTPLAITSHEFSTQNDFYVINLSSQLTQGTLVKLYMTFNYTLRDDLVGYYKSSYTLTNGETHYLATTQFEPTDARRAFPCFDEPAMKANFSIILTHPVGFNAVSNMPVSRTVTQGSLVETSFETSYKMSTYLVAFVVSNFECSDPDVVNNHIKVRVCARSDVFSSTTYSQSVADIVIAYYERFFGVDYPLPKQDLFAIPDFAAGAMENWGLITYRETALLFNETLNPVASQQRVAVVVAHELAHQWFGNLVTMSWWDGLWLNEGFASYVEYIGTAEAEPTWMMLDQFFIDTVQSAFDADGLNWSHPIIQQVHNPDEINGLFDSISYDKGASLIQMLRHYVGNETFTKGLKLYLKSHKFGNAETHELWDAFDQVSSSHQVSISSMMDTWTKQMGYPVITISTTTTNGATVRQDRFLQNPLPVGSVMATSNYNYVWTIPFDFITQNGNGQSNQKLITEAQDTINWDSASDGFIKANVNQTGFYRVNYDEENWNRIINHLMINPQSRPNVLSAVDRAGLLEDAFALSSAGLLNVTVALKMSRFLKTEQDYVPWMTGLRWFSLFGQKLSLTSTYGKFKHYMLSLMSDITNQLNFDATNLDHLHMLMQASILRASYSAGNDSIGETSLAMFRNWMNGGPGIAPNFRVTVYRIAIATGGEEEWNYLWNWYQTTTNPYEKRLCLYGLAESTEPWILNRYLQYSLTKVRSQDSMTVLASVSRNIHGRYLAWNFFRDNYDTIFKKYGGGSFSFSSVILTLTETFATEWELQEITSFFEGRDAGSGTLAVSQAKEVVRGNIGLISSNQKVIDEWLDDYIESL